MSDRTASQNKNRIVFQNTNRTLVDLWRDSLVETLRDSLVETLRERTSQRPDQVAYRFLKDGQRESDSLTYQQLYERVMLFLSSPNWQLMERQLPHQG